MSRITLPGSLALAIIACMPAFAGLLNVKAEFAQFFGGTSLLIFGRCGFGYFAADRKPFVDETL